jgi:2',3'-cyclic-nucleotide 2'-phosphodiesterase (5'-nucleotidase family)
MGLEENSQSTQAVPLSDLCAGYNPKPVEDIMGKTGTTNRLTIFYTNDLHSAFENMPKVAGAIRTFRDLLPADEVLTVDIGDHLDRMALETDMSDGLANVEALNLTGYDFLVPGNREGHTFTPEQWAEMYNPANAGFKVLCANVEPPKRYGKTQDWLRKWAIVEKGGIRIGLFGLSAISAKFASPIGWRVTGRPEAAAEMVKLLRPQVSVLILLSHLGLNADKRLVEELPGIDLIFGGHSHHLLREPLKIGDTWLFAAGERGHHVGIARVDIDMAAGRIISASCDVVETANYPADAKVAAVSAKYREMSETYRKNPQIELDEPLEAVFERESVLGNLLAAGVSRHVGTEIGIVNTGQFVAGLESGTVTYKRLLACCPSPAKPCRAVVTGKQIRRALEDALKPEVVKRGTTGFGFSGMALGTLCVDGLTVQYRPDAPAGERIGDVRVIGPRSGDRSVGGETDDVAAKLGELLDEERSYTVGTVDLFTFGHGYPVFAEASEVTYFPDEFMRDVLVEQLKRPEEIARAKMVRWVVANTLT